MRDYADVLGRSEAAEGQDGKRVFLAKEPKGERAAFAPAGPLLPAGAAEGEAMKLIVYGLIAWIAYEVFLSPPVSVGGAPSPETSLGIAWSYPSEQATWGVGGANPPLVYGQRMIQ